MATSDAIVDIDGLNWESLPNLHHIMSQLAETPVFNVLKVNVVEGKGVADLATAKDLIPVILDFICYR